MAAKIKGIDIAITADTSGVTKGLKEVTNESIKTSKNLKTVESLLKLNPKDTELLAEKQKLLSKNIEETKEKLKKLKDAQNDVKAAFDRGEISEEQYIAFQGEIVKTESRLKSLENQVDGTGTAMKKANTETSNFGEKLKNGLQVGAKAAAAAIAAVSAAVVACTKKLVDFSVEGAAYADTILTDSIVTGIATDKLQEYHYAAELVDVSTETLTKSMAKNIKSMTSAAKGTGDTAEAYKKLGVNVKNSDGSLRDSQTVYWELIDALGKVENETERDSMAMQILGKSAQELNPLIEAGSKRMQELGKQAHEAGAVLSDDALNSFGEFDDQIQYLKVNAEAAKNALGMALLPALKSLAGDGNSALTSFTNAIAQTNGDAGKMAEVFASLIPTAIEKLTSSLPQILDFAKQIVVKLVDGIVQQLPTILNTGMQLIQNIGNGLAKAMPKLIPQVVDIVLNIVDTILDNIDMLIDVAIQLIIALSDGLINALPVLLEKAPVIIDKIVTAIVNNLPKLVSASLQMVVSLVKGIIQNLPQLYQAAVKIVESLLTGVGSLQTRVRDAGRNIIQKFKDGVKSLASDAVNWGKDMLQGFINGVNQKLSDLKEKVKDVANTIRSHLHFSVPDVGPLKDYESWMPDFMKGLADGIEKNKKLVTNAVRGLANDMVMSPSIGGSSQLAGNSMSQIININLNANIANGMDLNNVAEQLGRKLQSITAQNNTMRGAYN